MRYKERFIKVVRIGEVEFQKNIYIYIFLVLKNFQSFKIGRIICSCITVA